MTPVPPISPRLSSRSMGQLKPRGDGHGQLILARFDRRRSAAAPMLAAVAAAGRANSGRAGSCSVFGD